MRGARIASASGIPNSITLRITWLVAEMMRGPPAAPATICTVPCASSTMVGDMAESIRLPGSILFASPCTRPNMFGLPGCTAKSSISSFIMKPTLARYTPLPHELLSVVVVDTALPSPSTTE